MSELNKTILLSTTKEIGLRAIPYLLIVPLLIIIHLFLLALWYYFHQDLSTTARVLVVVFGIVLPILAYVPWGDKALYCWSIFGHSQYYYPTTTISFLQKNCRFNSSQNVQ